jgi:VCBS repeat-containing protein
VDDDYSTDEDNTLIVDPPGVLVNDIDIGSPLQAVLVSSTTHGSLTFDDTGNFVYVPDANYNGADHFTYFVTDGSSSSNVATVTIVINPVNDAPLAVNNAYSTHIHVALVISAPGVLGNDSDIDGDTLTAETVAGPSHGTLTLNSNGRFTYTPNSNFTGLDSFTYAADDGDLTGQAAVLIDVVDEAPEPANDSYITDEDTPLSIAAPGVLDNDSDPDDDPLYAFVVSQPGHGSVSLNANGSFVYTPSGNYNGTDSFVYASSDLALATSATVTISVNPVNDAPVAVYDSFSAVMDAPIAISPLDLLGNDWDLEGDSLSVQIISGPLHGTLTSSNGTWIYSPVSGFVGQDAITYAASDGALQGMATASMTMKPAVRIGQSLTGAVQSAALVPDTIGAVGPKQIALLENDQYAVFDQSTGRQLLQMSDEEFWNRAFGVGSSADLQFTLSGASTGSFSIYYGPISKRVDRDSSPSTETTRIETALAGLFGPGNTVVFLTGDAPGYRTYRVEFVGQLERSKLSSVTLVGANVSGFSSSAAGNEVQRLALHGQVGSGTFKLNGLTLDSTVKSSTVTWDSNPATMQGNLQTALNAIYGKDANNVSNAKVLASGNQEFEIHFCGDYAGINVATMTITEVTLSTGTVGIDVIDNGVPSFQQEVQRLTFSGGSDIGSTFTLKYGPVVIASNIAYSSTPATLVGNIQAALTASSVFGSGRATASIAGANEIDVTFGGDLAGANLTSMTAIGTNVTVAVGTVKNGVSKEVQQVSFTGATNGTSFTLLYPGFGTGGDYLYGGDAFGTPPTIVWTSDPLVMASRIANALNSVQMFGPGRAAVLPSGDNQFDVIFGSSLDRVNITRLNVGNKSGSGKVGISTITDGDGRQVNRLVFPYTSSATTAGKITLTSGSLSSQVDWNSNPETLRSNIQQQALDPMFGPGNTEVILVGADPVSASGDCIRFDIVFKGALSSSFASLSIAGNEVQHISIAPAFTSDFFLGVTFASGITNVPYFPIAQVRDGTGAQTAANIAVRLNNVNAGVRVVAYSDTEFDVFFGESTANGHFIPSGGTNLELLIPSYPTTPSIQNPVTVTPVNNGDLLRGSVFISSYLSRFGGNSRDATDPRIIFDQTSQRWFASAMALTDNPVLSYGPGRTAKQLIVLAVSNSADLNDGWKAFTLTPDPTDTYWVDFPALGADADGVHLSVNSNGGHFVIAIPKNDLYPSNSSFSPIVDHAKFLSGGAMQPVIDAGPADGIEPLIEVGLTRVDIQGLQGNGPITLSNPVSVPDSYTEIQRLKFGGSIDENAPFRLGYENRAPVTVAYSNTPATLLGNIQGGLNSLFGPGNAVVANAGSGRFTIKFQGTFGATDLKPMTVDGSSLTGTNPRVELITLADGAPMGAVPQAPQANGHPIITVGIPTATAVYKQGDSFWLAFGVSIDPGTPSERAGVRWMQIDATSNTVLQAGNISAPDLWLYFPSLAVNAARDVVIGFTASNATNTYPSADVVVGTTDVDGITTFGDIAPLQAGRGTWNYDPAQPDPNVPPPNNRRWGDYSATVPDPNTTDPTKAHDFWTFQEYTYEPEQVIVDGGQVRHVGTWAINVTQIHVTSSANARPTASDVSTFVTEDTPKTFSVSTSGNVQTIRISKAPQHGILTVNANNTLTYTPDRDSNAAEFLEYQAVAADGNSSAPARLTIFITPVNDRPTLDAIDDPPEILEDSGLLVAIPLTGISAGPVNESYQTLSLQSGFTKLDGSSAGLFFDPISTSPYLSPNPAGIVSYKTAANRAGDVRVTITVHDDGGTFSGGVDNFSQPFTVKITPVNDAPSGTDNTITTLEDSPVTLAVSAFGFSDPDDVPANDDTPADLFAAVKITSLPTAGTLKLDGVAVQAGQLVTVNDINANKLAFYPAANGNGTGYATFAFQVQDNGGTEHGGIDLEPPEQAHTITLNVTAVNDPPSFTKGPDKIVHEGAGAQTFANWATNISAGPPNETGQTLTFQVVGNTNTALFSIQPQVSSTGTLTFTPASNTTGSATITINLHDNGGTANGGQDTSGSQTFTITLIVNHAPTGLNDSYVTDKNATLTVSAGSGVLANDSDVDGDTLTAQLIQGPGHGSLSLNSNGSFVYTPSANYYGNDSFTYRPFDGSITSASDITVSLRVNAPPQALDNGLYMNIHDTTLITGVSVAGVLTNDYDPDYDTLTAVLVSNPAHGSVTLNSDGNFTYTPAANYSGLDSFTYKAFDGRLYSNVATVTIWNDPVAYPDSYTTYEDYSINYDAVPGGLLYNDYNHGAGLTASVVTGPSHGNLILNSDGSFTYTPAANYNGTDTFTYRATNGSNLTGVATVTISMTPLNDLPVGVNDSYVTDKNATLTVSAGSGVLANDSDIDGDTLTAQLIQGPGHGNLSLNSNGSFVYTPTANYYGNDSFTYRPFDGSITSATNITVFLRVNAPPQALDDGVYMNFHDTTLITGGNVAWVTYNDNDPDFDTLTAVLVSNPAHGSVTLNSDGNFTYTPAANYSGLDSFTYKAFDGRLYSNVATVTIWNDPVAYADSYTTYEDYSINYNAVPGGLLYNDYNHGAGLTASVVTGPSHGSLTLNSDGSFTYTPAANYNGTDTFTYRATNGSNLTGVATVTISMTPVNDPPTFTKGADQNTTDESGAFSINGWATNISAGPANESGQSLTFHVTADHPELFSVQPAVNAATGTLTFTPMPNIHTSTATITVTLQDNGGTFGQDTSSAQNFTITVTKPHPRHNSVFPEDVNADGYVTPRDAQRIIDYINAHGPSTVSAGDYGPNYYDTADASVSGNGDNWIVAGDALRVINWLNAHFVAPSFTKGANQSTTDESSAQTVTGWATNMSLGTLTGSGLPLTFHVTVDHSEFFSVQPAINATTGTLTYTPKSNAHGTATVTVTLAQDAEMATSAAQTFTITVSKPHPRHNNVQVWDVSANGYLTPLDAQLVVDYINGHGSGPVAAGDYGPYYYDVTGDNYIAPIDAMEIVNYINAGYYVAPSFTKGANQTTTDESGAQTVTGWATNMTLGTLSGSGLPLTFHVTTNHPEYFSVQPAINATTGTLTYTPAPNAHGTATMTVTLAVDSEMAVSSAQTFTITANKPHPRHNVDQLYDVNGDGLITSSDAQRVTDYINSHGTGPISAGDYGPDYVDVDGDNYLAPIDTLTVINYINALLNGVGGLVYIDDNEDGIHQSNESGIQGVVIHLAGIDGSNHSFDVTTTTAANGRFLFPLQWTSNGVNYNLANGSFTISIHSGDEPAGYWNGFNKSDNWMLVNNGVSNPYAYLDPQAVDTCVIDVFAYLAAGSPNYNRGQLVSFAKLIQ